MDERIEKALEFIKHTSTIARNKENLRIRFELGTLFQINGGTFVITPELIAYAEILGKHRNEAVFIDRNNEPVMISDVKKFQNDISEAYLRACDEFHKGYQELTKE